jgi:hypothetical protein
LISGRRIRQSSGLCLRPAIPIVDALAALSACATGRRREPPVWLPISSVSSGRWWRGTHHCCAERQPWRVVPPVSDFRVERAGFEQLIHRDGNGNVRLSGRRQAKLPARLSKPPRSLSLKQRFLAGRQAENGRSCTMSNARHAAIPVESDNMLIAAVRGRSIWTMAIVDNIKTSRMAMTSHWSGEIEPWLSRIRYLRASRVLLIALISCRCASS